MAVNKWPVLIPFFMASAATAPPAAAQDEAPLAPFRACTSVTPEAERLACFEAALNSAEEYAKVRRQVLREREQRLARSRSESAPPPIASSRRDDDFGLTKVEIERRNAEFDRPERAVEGRSASSARRDRSGDEDDAIRATVVDRWQTATGAFVLQLDNGQIWREKSGSDIRLPEGEGFEVEISKGFLSGYRLKTAGVTGLGRVERIR